jgi:hypothetical protein
MPAATPLAGLAPTCDTPPLIFSWSLPVFRRSFHSICRTACLAAVLTALATTGCATWSLDRFNVNQLRDDRAVDIDHRLEGARPLEVSPF